MINGLLLSIRDILSFPDLRLTTLKIWKRNFLFFYRNLLSSVFWLVFEPLLYLVAFGYGISHLVENINGMPYWIFFAPSVIAITTMLVPFYETSYGFFKKIEKGGVYESFAYLPIKIEEIFVAEVLWGTTKGFIGSSIILAILFAFGFVHKDGVLLILPILLVSSWLFSAIGLLVSTFVKNSNMLIYVQMALLLPMTLFCGTFFPTKVYPEVLRNIILAVPFTNVVEQIRALAIMQLQPSGFLMLIVPCVLAVLFTNWSISRAKRFVEEKF